MGCGWRVHLAHPPPKFRRKKPLCILERIFQTKLHLPRGPGTGYFSISDVVLAQTDIITKRTGRRFGVATDTGGFELGMVEGVERLPTKLQNGPFAAKPRQREVLGQRDIPVVAAWPVDGITSHIAEHAGGAIRI